MKKRQSISVQAERMGSDGQVLSSGTPSGRALGTSPLHVLLEPLRPGHLKCSPRHDTAGLTAAAPEKGFTPH